MILILIYFRKYLKYDIFPLCMLYFFQLPRNPRSQLINVLEVDDPKISIVFHMIAPLEPVTPHLESPLAEPMVLLRQLAKEDLDRGKELQMHEGFTLKNLEANCKCEFDY